MGTLGLYKSFKGDVRLIWGSGLPETSAELTPT